MTCGVVILAAGSGSRFGAELPKQYCVLNNKPVWLWSALFFQAEPSVTEIVIVAHQDYHRQICDILEQYKDSKFVAIVGGGAKRQDSVFNGISRLATDYVAVHDGARPFPPATFSQLLEKIVAANSIGNFCGCFVQEVTDTIRHRESKELIPRQDLLSMQTPQIGKTQALVDALTTCNYDMVDVTDDVAAWRREGADVIFEQGSSENIKITYPVDLMLAHRILTERLKQS